MGMSTDDGRRCRARRLPSLSHLDVAKSRCAGIRRSGSEPATRPRPTLPAKARFYGLDLYSLRTSIEAVIGYLEQVDPAEAQVARRRYSCFDHVGVEGQAYGHAVVYQGRPRARTKWWPSSLELRRRAELYLRRDGWVAEDEQFYAEQNARLVRDAEEYYHQMYRAEVSSWNLRDQHMAGTLDALIDHLDGQSNNTKVVVWRAQFSRGRRSSHSHGPSGRAQRRAVGTPALRG